MDIQPYSYGIALSYLSSDSLCLLSTLAPLSAHSSSVILLFCCLVSLIPIPLVVASAQIQAQRAWASLRFESRIASCKARDLAVFVNKRCSEILRVVASSTGGSLLPPSLHSLENDPADTTSSSSSSSVSPSTSTNAATEPPPNDGGSPSNSKLSTFPRRTSSPGAVLPARAVQLQFEAVAQSILRQFEDTAAVAQRREAALRADQNQCQRLLDDITGKREGLMDGARSLSQISKRLERVRRNGHAIVEEERGLLEQVEYFAKEGQAQWVYLNDQELSSNDDEDPASKAERESLIKVAKSLVQSASTLTQDLGDACAAGDAKLLSFTASVEQIKARVVALRVETRTLQGGEDERRLWDRGKRLAEKQRGLGGDGERFRLRDLDAIRALLYSQHLVVSLFGLSTWSSLASHLTAAQTATTHVVRDVIANSPANAWRGTEDAHDIAVNLSALVLRLRGECSAEEPVQGWGTFGELVLDGGGVGVAGGRGVRLDPPSPRKLGRGVASKYFTEAAAQLGARRLVDEREEGATEIDKEDTNYAGNARDTADIEDVNHAIGGDTKDRTRTGTNDGTHDSDRWSVNVVAEKACESAAQLAVSSIQTQGSAIEARIRDLEDALTSLCSAVGAIKGRPATAESTDGELSLILAYAA